MAIEESKNEVLKSNLVFGSAQVVQMITTLLRAKFIAVFLSASGIGLNAIIQSILLTIYTISSCGIIQSCVREFSIAKNESESSLISLYSIFRKLILLSCFIGFTICILGAWPISVISLGNSSYTLTFAILGIGVFFYIYMHAEMAVLQGTRNLVMLAKASFIGSIVNLIVCIPCYYYFNINGVIISIVIGNFIYWLIYRFYTRQLKLKAYHISIKESIKVGRPMILLGFFLMIGSFIISLFTYLTNISIRILGNLDDVGFYQGAASITTQSIVVVIAILASDFYPRLSAVVKDKSKQNQLINQQLDLIILIILPIIVLIICFSELIVELLLTENFVIIIPLLKLMSISLLFRGLWITMSYVILANGDRKKYLKYDAIIGNGLNFLINIVAYYLGGLELLGVSYIISALIISYILYRVTVNSYGVKLERRVIYTILISILLIIISYYANWINFWIGFICSLFVTIISLLNLILRYNLFSILKLKK